MERFSQLCEELLNRRIRMRGGAEGAGLCGTKPRCVGGRCSAWAVKGRDWLMASGYRIFSPSNALDGTAARLFGAQGVLFERTTFTTGEMGSSVVVAERKTN